MDGGRGRVLLVVGAGRSGTSLFGLLCQRLGMHVPAPEVPADASNPRGFAESAWTVQLHDRVLARAHVAVADARPDAAGLASSAVDEVEVDEAAAWLRRHARTADAGLLVKDPRAALVLPMWHEAADRAGLLPVHATLLRPPAEVVASNLTHYRHPGGAAHLTGAWLSLMLHTERATRGLPRTYVGYADLLAQPTGTLRRVGEILDLHPLRSADPSEVAGLVDARLRRETATWADLPVAPSLARLADDVWGALGGGSPGGVPDPVRMDAAREEYAATYRAAEELTRSTRNAERRALRVALGRGGPGRAARWVRAAGRRRPG